MITASTWQGELRAAVTSVGELLRLLDLPVTAAVDLQEQLQFPIRVPRSFIARMRPRDWNDPLLRQVLPLAAERTIVAGFGPDPLHEASARRAPGLLQKYAGRALLITTGSCAVHCRYCFRREFPYQEHLDGAARWASALAELAADPSVHEVILSGGDPLSLSTDRLRTLVNALAAMPQVRRLRIHTRLPIVLPARIDAELLEWLHGITLPLVIVLHANHANEIDADVRRACVKLKSANAVLLNQSVLLRGINDTEDALAGLSEALFDAGVLPYYLHLLDRVSGTAHFEVDEVSACKLLGRIATRLPGYLVPRLVRELAGAAAKVALLPEFCEPGPLFIREDAAVRRQTDAKLSHPDVGV